MKRLANLTCLVALVGLFLSSCTPRPQRQVFHFETGVDPSLTDDRSPTEPPLDGTAASYKIPARRGLNFVSPLYGVNRSIVNDPVFGQQDVLSETYTEEIERSPYFLQRSDEETLPDTPILSFDVTASHRLVPRANSTVFVRASILAPAVSSGRRGGMNLAIVLDASDSMNSPGKLPLLKRAARSLIAQLLPNDRATLVAYNDRGRVLVPWREVEDPTVFTKEIDRLTVGGGANVGAGLYEAYTAVKEAEEHGAGKGHVILLSDGLFGEGAWRSVDLARGHHQRGTRLSTVAVGKSINPKPLSELAEAGEGRFLVVDQERDVASTISNEMQSILKSYAKNVRLRILNEDVTVLAVYGRGVRSRNRGERELVLSDFAAGEERSVLLHLRLPTLSNVSVQQLQFRLFFKQERPIRRTTLERNVSFQASKGYGPVDQSVDVYSRLVQGLDSIRRAVDGEGDVYIQRAVEAYDRDLAKMKAYVVTHGDPDLVEQLQNFEDLAGRMKKLSVQGNAATDDDWGQLRRDVYSKL